MKKYHLMIATVLLAVLIYPSVTFASWWNPFSWFNKKQEVRPVFTGFVMPPSLEDKKPIDKTPVKVVTPHKESSQPVQKVPLVKSCKPELQMLDKVPTWAEGNLRGYFQKVIASNPPLNNLEAIRTVLITYREQMIKSSSGQVVPDSILRDENGERIPFTAGQLGNIESSYGGLYTQAIEGYLQWIQLSNKLIIDKKADGCLDGRDLYDYM